MSTEELIRCLESLAKGCSSNVLWEISPDTATILYRAAATIKVLREELKYLLDKEREI